MMKPKISVITISLNDATGLKKSIESMMLQTHSNREHIIMDGGSTDKSKQIIKKYSKMLSKAVSEKDDGIYDAMNKGVGYSTGDIVYFLNAGDVFHSNEVLEKIAREFKKSDKKEMVYGGVLVKYPNNEILSFRKFCNKNLRAGIIPPHQGMFVKKDVFDQIGPFRKEYISSGDLEWFCRYNKIKKHLESKILQIDLIVSDFLGGGISGDKQICYPETYKIINIYFGKFFSRVFYLRKIIIEQSIKKMLIKLHLFELINKIYLKLIERKRP
jgi:glycosyltransferase involved in cell wall biosynthesis